MDNNNKKLRGKPASSAGKEEEPVAGGAELKEAPSEHRELEKRKETGEYVREIPLRPEIPPEIEKIGVKHAGAGAPVKKKPSKKIQLPLTDDQIVAGLHAHVWQSIRWLAVWCVRKLKKMHIAVKEVHGRLIRN